MSRAKLTARERACLGYLTFLMEAPAQSVGRAIYDKVPGGGSNLASIGGTVLSRLRKKGFVTRLPDLHAWRITPAGRSALEASDT